MVVNTDEIDRKAGILSTTISKVKNNSYFDHKYIKERKFKLKEAY